MDSNGEAGNRILELLGQREELRAVCIPLLEHYLDCYNGNVDELAARAQRVLGVVKIEVSNV